MTAVDVMLALPALVILCAGAIAMRAVLRAPAVEPHELDPEVKRRVRERLQPELDRMMADRGVVEDRGDFRAWDTHEELPWKP